MTNVPLFLVAAGALFSAVVLEDMPTTKIFTLLNVVLVIDIILFR